MKARWLILEDGTQFQGQALGSDQFSQGELVVHTAMTGYMECLTDPSFQNQYLCLTYPMIGNYGVSQKQDYFQSSKIQVSALILNDLSEYSDQSEEIQSLQSFLEEQQIATIVGIDTRLLMKHVRQKGSMQALFCDDLRQLPQFKTISNHYLSSPKIERVNTDVGAKFRLLLIDCGCKSSIINFFQSRNIELIIVNHSFDYHSEQSLVGPYDGILIS
ncbi:hypothetical protein MJH12_16860, partial [bacterium]|nr:hypothetical protein [bacterium]